MRKTASSALIAILLIAMLVAPLAAQDVPASPNTGSTWLPFIGQGEGIAAAGRPIAEQGGGSRNNQDAVSGPTVDQGYALVQLVGEPLATYEKTKPPQGKKIDFEKGETKSYRALLAARRNEFKQWLRKNAPKARVTGEYEIAINAVSVQLNGMALETIAKAPMVAFAQYQGLYYPMQAAAVDPDLSLVGLPNGDPNGGAGIKVAIVDSGIDQSHSCFNPAGYTAPAGFPRGQVQYTNAKVIVAKVFNNKLNQSGFDAKAVDSHGTHVAGTVACNYQTPATVDGVAIPYAISGVAPKAFLGNYNVFPGTVEDARSEDILNALDAAYADGMDVANMSLGGGYHGVQDLLMTATDNFDQAGMLIAIAAGNEGPGYGTVSSPGAAARGLTAGASTVPHFLGTPVTATGFSALAASGELPLVGPGGLTAALAVTSGDGVAGLSRACTPFAAGTVTGKIALVSRGTCTFSNKVFNAEADGAVAVLVVNNVAGDPTAMAADGVFAVTIPAYMLGMADGSALAALANPGDVTIGDTPAYQLTSNANIMAGFSNWGPGNVDFRVKPDLVAPGVNVISSIPNSYCDPGVECFAFFSGTSMATPHLAGAAAVVKGYHPDWSAAQIRSAITNTADRYVLRSYNTAATVMNVNVIGGGLLDVPAALNAAVALDPVSVSFGAVPSGSGQTRTATIVLSNLLGAGPYTVAAVDNAGVADTDADGVLFTASIDGNIVTVTTTAAKGAAAQAQGYQAWLVVSQGGVEVAHAALYTFVK